MKKLIFLIIFNVIYASLFAKTPPKPPVYQAIQISDNDISIDGNLNEKVWEQAKWTDYFLDIQGSDFPIPEFKTQVKILWSDSMVYFGAFLEEPHIWAKIKEDEKVMYYDNDFEIFIDPNGDNHNYYEFEFNALNKKWDLFLKWPYRDTLKPDLAWNCKGLRHATKIYGSINKSDDVDSAWTLEVAIPVLQIASEIKANDVWRVNFSRVQWKTDIVEEEYLKKDLPENNWVWSPTWKINMHCPEYWGFVQFIEAKNNESYSISDRKWRTRCDLMDAYEERKKQWRNNNKYDSIKISDEEIHIEDENGFRYILSKADGQDVLMVNEKGKLWKEKKEETPRFWIWMSASNIQSITKWDSILRDIHDLGIRGLLLQAPPETIRKIIPLAQKYNIQIHVWMWTMNRRDAPTEYLSVNDLGQSLANQKAYVDYYKFLCPALPETKDFIRKKIRDLERIDGVSGIHLDYIRYVDVFLPKGLLPKYNLIQDDILPKFDYGYHPAMLTKFKKTYGYDVKSIPDYPHDSLWQQFRMDQITNIVNDFAWEFSSKPVKLTAAVFPDPEMSRKMVRQDWGAWKLDYYFPMVYNGFYNEDENWIEERIRISKKFHPNSNVFCGLYLPDSASEEELIKSMDAAFKGGASGISFFNYWGLKSYHRKVILKYSQLMGDYLSDK